MRHLRIILHVKWQDKVANNEILQRSGMPSIETILMKARLRWTGHVLRMNDNKLPKITLHGELKSGKRSGDAPRKRFKGCLRQNLKCCGLNPYSFESVTQDRL